MREPIIRMTAFVSLVACLAGPARATGDVRNRVAVLVDSSGASLLTPEVLTFQEACTGWNPCTFNGNPTPAQEVCNSCVIDTINFRPTCASSWTALCRNDYTICLQAITGSATCSATLTVQGGLSTRGDGSQDIPGCDVNGDGFANDSRLYQMKEALTAVFTDYETAVNFSLWRYSQLEGGRRCTANPDCPDTPGGLGLLECESVTSDPGAFLVCAYDADKLDGPTSAGREGQCDRLTFTGSSSTFTCNACDFASTYDRASCTAWDLDRVRTGATSPLNGTAVTCFPVIDPTHRFIFYGGAVFNGGGCEPSGGQRLADFELCPPSCILPCKYCSNLNSLVEWIDHEQVRIDNPAFRYTNELRAHGERPMAASLRDMRQAMLATLAADSDTPCRRVEIVVIAGGAESCETNPAVISAAAALQNLSFTNPSGVQVTDYDVPVHVIGLGVCPPANPNCPAAQDLNAVAAAGGTGAAVFVNTRFGLQQALDQIAAASIVPEVCNGIDDDCNGAVDDGFGAPGATPVLALKQVAGGTELSWSAVAPVTGYDAVSGSLASLRGSGGDFTTATSTCLADDAVATSLIDSSMPGPADARWYLIRPVNCQVAGTWDSGAASQQGPRDAEIAASPSSCM